MAAMINTNISSLNAQRNLTTSQNALSTSLQRLSSGLRINSAKDDAAGLAISEQMTTQIRGLNQAARNANDGISLAQTAEGALATMGDMLQRMRELTVQAANGSNSTDSWAALDAEFQALGTEVDRIATSTTFNGLAILAADAGTITFQVGANNGDSEDVTTTDQSTVGSDAAATALESRADALDAMDLVDAAITLVSTDRAALGASQNTLAFTISNLSTAAEAQTSAKSRIMDTDFASETAALTRGQILQQAGTAMLAQANSLPNTVLSLLK
jgi:flagellin